MGLAEGFTLIALALDAVEEHTGSQKGHQNVASAVTAKETVDKGVIHGGGAGSTDGADSALDYQNEQDDGHNGGQDLADLIQCGAAILGEQERDHEVENDENQIGRHRARCPEGPSQCRRLRFWGWTRSSRGS